MVAMAEVGQSPEFFQAERVADLESVWESVPSISRAKQGANEFHIDDANGDLLSDSNIYKEFRRRSDSFVGQEETGRRVVFTVAPTKLRPRKYRGEIPVSAINTMEYARDITQLQAIEGALSSGQISEIDAYEQSAWVLGVKKDDVDTLLGDVYFPQSNDFIEGVHPSDALAVRVAKRQRSKEMMLATSRSSSVGGAEAKLATRTDGMKPESAILGGGLLAAAVVSVSRLESKSKISKVINEVLVGTTVMSLVLSACSPVTPIVKVRPKSESSATAEVVDLEMLYKLPTETSEVPYIIETPTAEPTGVGLSSLLEFSETAEAIDGVEFADPLSSERGIDKMTEYVVESLESVGLSGELYVIEVTSDGEPYGLMYVSDNGDQGVFLVIGTDAEGKLDWLGRETAMGALTVAKLRQSELENGSIVWGFLGLDSEGELAVDPRFEFTEDGRVAFHDFGSSEIVWFETVNSAFKNARPAEFVIEVSEFEQAWREDSERVKVNIEEFMNMPEEELLAGIEKYGFSYYDRGYDQSGANHLNDIHVYYPQSETEANNHEYIKRPEGMLGPLNFGFAVEPGILFMEGDAVNLGVVTVRTIEPEDPAQYDVMYIGRRLSDGTRLVDIVELNREHDGSGEHGVITRSYTHAVELSSESVGVDRDLRYDAGGSWLVLGAEAAEIARVNIGKVMFICYASSKSEAYNVSTPIEADKLYMRMRFEFQFPATMSDIEKWLVYTRGEIGSSEFNVYSVENDFLLNSFVVSLEDLYRLVKSRVGFVAIAEDEVIVGE